MEKHQLCVGREKSGFLDQRSCHSLSPAPCHCTSFGSVGLSLQGALGVGRESGLRAGQGHHESWGRAQGPWGGAGAAPVAAKAQARPGRALGGQAGRPCAHALDTARVPRPPEPQVRTGVWRPVLESARLRKDSRLETSLLCWQ